MIKAYTPATLRELLRIPAYRQFFLIIPDEPINPRWQVWGIKWTDRWAGRTVDSYVEGVDVVKKLLRDKATYRDVVLSAKNTEYAPPRGFPDDGRWCGRCRRPTVYLANYRHPGLRGAPIIADVTAPRCYFCGLNRDSPHFYRTTP